MSKPGAPLHVGASWTGRVDGLGRNEQMCWGTDENDCAKHGCGGVSISGLRWGVDVACELMSG